MRRTFLLAVVVGLGLAGCSSGASTPSAAPTSAASTASPSPADCNLKSAGDVIVRMVVPNGTTTAERVGSVFYATCKPEFDMLAQITSTDPGFCTTAAWAKDNVGYDVDAVPAPPLKKIQAQAGAACG